MVPRTPPRPAALAAAGAALLAACSADGAGPSLLDTVFAPQDPARFAYAVHFGDSTLSSFVVDGDTGRLQHRSYFAYPNLDTMPQAAAVHHDREVIFVVEAATETLSTHHVDQESGVLTGGSFQVGLGSGPHDVVAHATLDYVYACASGANRVWGFEYESDSDTLVSVDDTQPYTTAFNGPSQLLIDRRGQFLVVVCAESGGIQTFVISDIGRLDVGGSTLSFGPGLIGGAALDAAGSSLYVSLANADSIVRVEIGGDAQLTVRESVPTAIDPETEAKPLGVTLHPTGNFLYVLNDAAQTIFYYAVDRETLMLEPLGVLASTAGAEKLVFEPVGRRAYLIDSERNSLFRYVWDQTTGALAFREETRARVTPRDLVFVQDAVPPEVLPDHMYAAARGSDDVFVYAVSPGSGALSQLGPPVPAGSDPIDVEVSSTRPIAFVANAGSGDLSRYAVDEDGRLGEILPRIDLAGLPAALALDPSDRFLYVASAGTEAVQGFAVLEDSQLLPLGEASPVGDDPAAAAIDPTGRFLYVANGGLSGGGPGGTISVFAIDPRNGSLEEVIPGGTAPGGPASLAFSSTGGRLYTTLFVLDSVLPYDVSAETGGLALVGTGTPTLAEPIDIALSPTGRFAYVAVRDGANPGALHLFDVRESDGVLYNADDDTLTPRQTVAAGPSPVRLVIDPREDYVYVADEESDEVAIYGVASDGTLTPLTLVPSGAMPSDLELTTRVE